MTDVSAHINSTGASKKIRHLQWSLIYLPQIKIIFFSKHDCQKDKPISTIGTIRTSLSPGEKVVL